jgi:dTDP-4-amino-4,6-dideoxygalactose transaminase
VSTPDRDGLIAHLNAAGVGTGIHYPIPLHLQRAYEYLGYTIGAFPVAEHSASRIVSLPMFPQLTAEQQSYVAHNVAQFVEATTAA